MIENRSVPSATVIPELAYPDVGVACDWLCRAFGFRERLRIGNHRAQLTYRWTFSQSIADVDPAEWGGKLLAEN